MELKISVMGTVYGGINRWSHSTKVAIIHHEVPYIFPKLKSRQIRLSNGEAAGISTIH